jgi:hypothetical protein
MKFKFSAYRGKGNYIAMTLFFQTHSMMYYFTGADVKSYAVYWSGGLKTKT